MSPLTVVEWPTRIDPDLACGVHGVLHDVAAADGAIGYLTPPTLRETSTWLETVLTDVHEVDAALAVARIEALGLWRRHHETVFAHNAEIQKVVAHPHARGRGLGLAIALYERLGFTIWGRRPNVVEVRNHRFDEVRMSLTLGRPPGVILQGASLSSAVRLSVQRFVTSLYGLRVIAARQVSVRDGPDPLCLVAEVYLVAERDGDGCPCAGCGIG